MGNYLYNGVDLPDLNTVYPPELRKQYPYAAIRTRFSTDGGVMYATLYLFDRIEYCNVEASWADNGYYWAFSTPNGSKKSTYDAWYGDGTWEELEDDDSKTIAVSAFWENDGYSSWSNFDILNEDGTVYLPASYPINPETGEEIYDYDPIPVGSAPKVEPKSFMAGWRMGQIVRAMRMNSPGITPPEEEKIPIAYSYNGVVLPNIDTVWTDKTKYLYAYLSRVRMQNGDEVRDGYYLTLSNTRAYVSTTLIVGMWMVPTGSVVQQYFMDVNGSTYTLEMTSEHTEVFTEIALPAHITDEVQEYNCLWASVDICGENDSTIYLAASEPVPVYE